MKLNWVFLICGVSVAGRVASALIMGKSVEALPGIADQGSYHALALRLLGGHGFSFATDWWPATRAGEPTAHWSFLYTLYLAGVYAVFGAQPVIARLLQAVVVGVAWPVLTWRLGRRMGGETVGLLAAGWSAVYGYFTYYGGALMTEPFYITGILLTLELALRIGDGRRRWRDWLVLGLAMGATVLLRQLFLLFIPFLLGWVALKVGRGIRWADLVGAFAALAVVGLMIAPFTIRNYRAFGRFVLLNTNSGYAFFFGNHPIYGRKFQAILSGDVGYYELIPKQLLPLNEAALDNALMGEALNFIAADPVRYVQLSFSRIPIYFQFWPSPESSLLGNIVRVLSFGVALPFMLAGVIMAARDWRRWSLLYLFALVYTGIHILSWTLIRYRLPVDAVLLVFAAAPITALVRRIRGKSRASASVA